MDVHSTFYGAGKPTIHFFHGLGLDARMYKPLLQLLSENYTVVAYDIPPYRQSECNSLSFKKYLLELTNKIQPRINLKTDIVIGHSLGGAVASFFKAKKHIYLAPPTKPLFKNHSQLRRAATKQFKAEFRKYPFQSLRLSWNSTLNQKATDALWKIIDSQLQIDLTYRYNDTVINFTIDNLVAPHPKGIMVTGHHNFPIFEPKQCAKSILDILEKN